MQVYFVLTKQPTLCVANFMTQPQCCPNRSSPLLMRYITSPLSPNQHSVKMTHTLATSLLDCWASPATPDLTVSKQKKNLCFSEVLVTILQVWRCMGTFLLMITFIYWLLRSRIGVGTYYVRRGANEILVTKVQALTCEKAMCVRSQVSCPKQLHG
jgi:hypothetical protein